MIRFDHDICGNPAAALAREWLETNGRGGYASSTITGLNTRRYHGLLVAATKPPVGRIVMLSKFEETLMVDGRRYDLSANQYVGLIHLRVTSTRRAFASTHFRLSLMKSKES